MKNRRVRRESTWQHTLREKEEEDFLLANYQNKGLQECARVLNRTEVAVYQRWLALRKKVQVY